MRCLDQDDCRLVVGYPLLEALLYLEFQFNFSSAWSSAEVNRGYKTTALIKPCDRERAQLHWGGQYLKVFVCIDPHQGPVLTQGPLVTGTSILNPFLFFATPAAKRQQMQAYSVLHFRRMHEESSRQLLNNYLGRQQRTHANLGTTKNALQTLLQKVARWVCR